MQALFLQIRCRPGTTYTVANTLADKEAHSEMFSTSGEYDLLIKLYVEKNIDIGLFINDYIADIPDIERTMTTLTFAAFKT